MKKLLLLFVMIFTCSFSVFSQNYQHVTIRDIQYQDPATLTTYFDSDSGSTLNGDTVIVTGVVMQSPYKPGSDSLLMYLGGGSAGFYIQDTTQGLYDWSGVSVLHENDVYGEPQSIGFRTDC